MSLPPTPAGSAGTAATPKVLHTWTQDLRTHLHVHALVPCGALNAEGQWVTPKRGERFLFPVHALSRVFRGKFMAALSAAEWDGRLAKDPQPEASTRVERRRRLLRHDWVVYAKTALHGAAQVLDYLSRYTHRVAVSEERIVGIRGKDVLLRVRADSTGGKRCVRIDGPSFIARFLTHVLPKGFKRIRHYGWLGPAHKRERLAAARAALAMPAPNPIAAEQAADFMPRVARIDIDRCQHCHLGRWRIVQTLPPTLRWRAAPPIATARAPP